MNMNSNTNTKTTNKINPVEKNGFDSIEVPKDGPHLMVHSIYVKDLSFEAPRSPHIFNEEWNPELDFDLQLGSEVLDESKGLYEMVLHLTVTVKLPPESKAFLIEVKQAGIFTISGVEESVLKKALQTTCPTVLFPYVRETITNLVQKGGFPQLVLPPINFDAMFEQQLATQHD